MRTPFAVLAAALILGMGTLPTPARAAEPASVQARLADVASQVTQNAREIEQLQRTMDERRARIDRERAELRLLARALYVEPASPLLLLAQARDVGDALTRFTDLLSAADRARATKRALERDTEQLAAEKAKLEARRRALDQERRDLESEYARLVAAPVQPAPPPVPSGAIPNIIRQAWAPLGPATGDWAVRLALCESHLNPYAVNRSSAAAGLFQFLPSTWAGTPWHSQSPFDPVANSQAAAWLYQRYGPGQWECARMI